jgi:prepilin-type N-terminal cleavage/methylation domain-containing protein
LASKFFWRLRTIHSSGFSLLEIIFAMVLFSIGLMAAAAVMPLGARFVNSGKITSEAVSLATEKMEELQSLPVNSVFLVEGTYSDDVSPYQRSWAIRDDTPIPGMMHFEVTTSWEATDGTRYITLDTFVYR